MLYIDNSKHIEQCRVPELLAKSRWFESYHRSAFGFLSKVRKVCMKTPNLSMHHLLEHINQDIKRRYNKGKDSVVYKTEYLSKRNPTSKPQWA